MYCYIQIIPEEILCIKSRKKRKKMLKPVILKCKTSLNQRAKILLFRSI